MQVSPSSIVELFLDGGGEVKVRESATSLVYGNLSLQRVAPTALAISAVANVFGEWKAPQDQVTTPWTI